MSARNASGRVITSTAPAPHNLSIADYWPLKLIHKGVTRFFEEHASSLHGTQVVDLGSDESPYARLAAVGDAHLIATDINPTDPSVIAIDPATGRTALDDASIDAVISTQVLEHVPDVQGYLREAFRLLKPGGIFFSTHGTFILHRHPTGFRRWTIDGLKYELEQAGFFVDHRAPSRHSRDVNPSAFHHLWRHHAPHPDDRLAAPDHLPAVQRPHGGRRMAHPAIRYGIPS